MNAYLSLSSGLELLAKSVAVVLLGAGINLCFRRWSAAQRHALWLTVCSALLLLPLTKYAAPRWTVPLGADLLPPVRVTAVAPSRAPGPTGVTMPTARPPGLAWWRTADLSRVLLAGWAVGTVSLLGHRLLGSVLLARLRRNSRPCDDARVWSLAREAAELFRVKRRLEIRFSDRVRVPVTWGAWRPVVLLPAATAGAWDDLQLAAALRHEISHVARHDYPTRTLSQIVCALHWPNPLVWLAARALRTAQEVACDDLVLGGGTPAPAYAALLLEAARGSQRKLAFAPLPAISMARPSTLRRRVSAVVDDTRDRRPAGRGAVLLGLGAAGLLTAVSALAQVVVPGPATVPSPATAPSPADTRPSIEIETKFFEVPVGKFPANLPGAVPASLATTADGKSFLGPTILPDYQFLEIFQRKPGLDLLSAPRVTARSGQKATIEIRDNAPPPGTDSMEEFRKDDFIGTRLEVCPELLANGQIKAALELRTNAIVDNGVQIGTTSMAQIPLGSKPAVATRFTKVEPTVDFGQVIVFRQDLPPLAKQKDIKLELVITARFLRVEAGVSPTRPADK